MSLDSFVCIPVEVTSIGLPSFYPGIAGKAVLGGKESSLLALQFLQSWDVAQGRQRVAAETKASHMLEYSIDTRQDVIPFGRVRQ